MREIKFRAWDKDKKTMTTYFFINSQGTMCDANLQRYGKQMNAELMQYTGLKDKNGKEIYEGDIVTLVDKGEGQFTTDVKWSEEGLNFNLWYLYNPEQQWIVIGNIYENPELLEGGK